MGRISDVAIGASGLGGIYFLIFLMASLGLGVGAQIIIARFHGEGELNRIGTVFDHLLYLMAILAVGLIAVHFLFGPALLGMVITSPEILASTLDYLAIRAIGFIPAFLVLAYRSFLTGVSITRPISYAAGMTALLNLLFNYLFVFGKMGFPRMEIEGAAYASVLSEAFSLIYLILWVRQKKLGKEFSCFQFAKPAYSEIRSILKIAFPVMIQHVLSLASWLTFFLIIEGMGERPLAVSNVIRSVYSILMIPLIGLSQATQTLVSKVIGEGGTEIVDTLIKRLMIVSVLSSIVMVGLNLINPALTLSIFTNDASLIQDSMAIIPIISASIIIFATATVLLSVVSGTGNTFMTMVIEMSTLAIYLTFTILAVKKFHASLPIVWTSEFVYFICISVFAGIYLYTGKWKNTKVHD